MPGPQLAACDQLKPLKNQPAGNTFKGRLESVNINTLEYLKLVEHTIIIVLKILKGIWYFFTQNII